jgi:hypothetical protein
VGSWPNHRSPALRIWVDLHPLFPTTAMSCKARLHEESDRRGSNPRPPLGPQSVERRFGALHVVANAA